MKGFHRLLAIISVSWFITHMAIAGASVHHEHDTSSIIPSEYSQPHNSQDLTLTTQNKWHQVAHLVDHLVVQGCQFWTSLALANQNLLTPELQTSQNYLARLIEDSTRRQLFYSALTHSIP